MGRHAAGTGPAQTPGGSVSCRGAIWADLTGAPFSRDPATGDDNSLGSCCRKVCPRQRQPMRHRNCQRHRRRLHHRFFATRGAAHRIQVWRDAPAWKIRPRVASRANRTAIFRRCRCCRRRCRIAPRAAPDMATEISSAWRASSDRTLSRVFHNDLFQYFPLPVSNRAIASMPSTFRCSRRIAGTFRRRCGRTAGRW